MKVLRKVRDEAAFKNVWTQGGRIIYWDAVIDYILSEVYSHGTLRCLRRKEKIALAFVFFNFCFALFGCFKE